MKDNNIKKRIFLKMLSNLNSERFNEIIRIMLVLKEKKEEIAEPDLLNLSEHVSYSSLKMIYDVAIKRDTPNYLLRRLKRLLGELDLEIID